MPQDLVQIGLEHHRAGRFREAEATYRQAIEREPNDADALHWLGVLMHQAKRPADAVGLLERAVRLKPQDAAYLHNLGHAYLAAGRHAEAVAAFDRSAGVDPSRAEAWMGLGVARLARGEPEDRGGALGAFREARAHGLDTAEFHRQHGAAALMAGEVDEAIAAYRESLKREPHDAATHYHLALVHHAQEDQKETRKELMKAAEADPRFAKAWYGLGVLEAEAKQWALAAAMFRRAIGAREDYSAAFRALAQVLRESEQEDEAERVDQQAEWAVRAEAAGRMREPGSVEELERRVTPTADAAELQFALASAMRVMPPPSVPLPSLAKLFDEYAGRFDDHLRGRLQYRVPEQLAEALKALGVGERSTDVLDLGCGTGLSGQALRPMARTLVGVDLSAGMLEKARERGVYDRLQAGELVAATQAMPAASFDLIVATDVLIYMGDLLPVFQGVTRCLRPGGRFAFSVEAAGGERYDLRKNRRYGHAKPYLRKLAAMHGMVEEKLNDIAVRLEADKPVPGYLAVLRMPAS
jgi:predicted TPR repeat methyltransferase